MFIIIMVIILGTCVSVLSSIYYNTISLQKTYGSVNVYYWAYYWAMSSIERWLLMTKVKYPWYEWSWWFDWETIIWSQSNAFSWDFWRLSHWDNSMLRNITSKTNRIEWTIDKQTIRYISFKQYWDSYVDQYRSDIRGSWYYWIKDWLTFTGTITPTNMNTIDSKKLMMDFNRLFGMKTRQYTVRWLLNWKFKDQNEYEREDNLTGSFYFWESNNSSPYSYNPRPTTTWIWANNWE